MPGVGRYYFFHWSILCSWNTTPQGEGVMKVDQAYSFGGSKSTTGFRSTEAPWLASQHGVQRHSRRILAREIGNQTLRTGIRPALW